NFLFSGWRFILFQNELHDKFSKNPLFSSGRSIDYEFQNIPKKIREEFLYYFNKLSPIESIQKEIDKFSKKHKLSNFIGIHVRRGDFKESIEVSTDEKFIKRMKEILKENNSQKFFLCTDSKDTEENFRKIFPGKIISYKKVNFKRDNLKFVQEGLIDLYLLSKTKSILGSYLSSFTEVAWWLSDGKMKIEIMATNEEMNRVAAEKNKKIKSNQIKKIIYELFIPLSKRITRANTSGPNNNAISTIRA
nr:alpha-1,2-fucosyltransferase [Bacteroidales bacterium]